MADDVVYGKVATIERCLERIREDYVGHEVEFAIVPARRIGVVNAGKRRRRVFDRATAPVECAQSTRSA